jgi:peroxiredoxin Q/BCP
MLEPGAKAPAFTLLDQDGEKVKLTDLKGRTVVLYFYPKADTPGCTTQACGVRDNEAAYAERDVVVLGVSPDPPEKLKKFHDGQSLNFTLLSDPEHKICDKYGTWVEKSMYGRTYMGVARATFIIDPKGRVARVFPKVQPKQHDKLVLKALDELAAG